MIGAGEFGQLNRTSVSSTTLAGGTSRSCAVRAGATLTDQVTAPTSPSSPADSVTALLAAPLMVGLHVGMDLVEAHGAIMVGIDRVEILGNPRHRFGFVLVEGAVVVLVGSLKSRFALLVHALLHVRHRSFQFFDRHGAVLIGVDAVKVAGGGGFFLCLLPLV